MFISAENIKNILWLARTASHKNGTVCKQPQSNDGATTFTLWLSLGKFSLSSGIFKESTISDSSIFKVNAYNEK